MELRRRGSRARLTEEKRSKNAVLEVTSYCLHKGGCRGGRDCLMLRWIGEQRGRRKEGKEGKEELVTSLGAASPTESCW